MAAEAFVCVCECVCISIMDDFSLALSLSIYIYVCVCVCVCVCVHHAFLCATGTTHLVASGARKNLIRLVGAADACEYVTETCVAYRMVMMT